MERLFECVLRHAGTSGSSEMKLLDGQQRNPYIHRH